MNTLERYLFYDLRPIVLSILKHVNNKQIIDACGLHQTGLTNYIKYNHKDYSDLHQKPFRYLTYRNIIDILEYSGYDVDIQIKLKESEI